MLTLIKSEQSAGSLKQITLSPVARALGPDFPTIKFGAHVVNSPHLRRGLNAKKVALSNHVSAFDGTSFSGFLVR